MEQLSYNSTATSGLNYNRMLHTMVQSVFVTPFLHLAATTTTTGNHHSVKEVFVIPV
jgi:hypothetical protein